MDTNDVSYYPSIFLFRGFNPTLPYGPGNPQYLARFTSNRLTGFNVWEHTCAKIQPSVGNALPESPEGSWSWVNGNLPWNDFISNIDGIMFKGDVNEWAGQEIFILDNICMNSCDCTPPPSGMVAWWPLDETLGTVSHDISGIYNNNGTCLNGPVPGQGKVKAGLFFDGIDDYVEAPDQSELNFGTSNFSIDTWIKTSFETGEQSIVDKRRRAYTADIRWGYCFFLHEGFLSLELADGADYPAISYSDYITGWPSGYVADGFWHHVAVTVRRQSATGIKFYVDGVQLNPSIPCDRQGSITNNIPLRIGRQSNNYPTHLFSGILDEIEMFNRVLSPVEISSLYNAGSAGKCKPGILACDSCSNPLLSLHTGIGGATDSKWNLITAPSGVPTGAANIVYNWRQYGLNNPLEASEWVAPPWINPCPRAIPGTYTYTCQFNLPTCPSGSYPQLKICILGENATIKLNGNIVGVANSQVSVTHLSDVFFPDFVTGLNILQIELNNRSTQYPVFNAKVWICCGAQGPVAGCDSCPVILQNRHTGYGSSTDNNWSITSAPYGVATGPAYIIPYPSTYLPGPPIQQSQWISSGTPPPTVQGQYVFTCNFYNYMMQSPYYAKLYICVKGKNAEVNLNGQYIGTSCSAESFTQFVAYPSSMGPNTIKIVLVTSAGEYPVIDVKAWICREAISIIPTSGNIINTTIHTNEGFCYSVTDTLIVAGNLTTFLVENGGSATMVAGQVVSLMPGTTIQAGGYLHASITTTGQYCSSTKTSEYETPSGMETNSVPGSKPDDQSFRIYPNPTTGGFSLEFKDLEESAEFQVEIYSILGERMLSGKLQGQKRYELSLAGKPNGVYFIRVVSGKFAGTGKIVKQ
jgi:hypothetical protein